MVKYDKDGVQTDKQKKTRSNRLNWFCKFHVQSYLKGITECVSHY